MKKLLMTLAAMVSGIAIVLAMDLGRLAFTMVDAGGHGLRMLIIGNGNPTVVFETGEARKPAVHWTIGNGCSRR